MSKVVFCVRFHGSNVQNNYNCAKIKNIHIEQKRIMSSAENQRIHSWENDLSMNPETVVRFVCFCRCGIVVLPPHMVKPRARSLAPHK